MGPWSWTGPRRRGGSLGVCRRSHRSERGGHGPRGVDTARSWKKQGSSLPRASSPAHPLLGFRLQHCKRIHLRVSPASLVVICYSGNEMLEGNPEPRARHARVSGGKGMCGRWSEARNSHPPEKAGVMGGSPLLASPSREDASSCLHRRKPGPQGGWCPAQGHGRTKRTEGDPCSMVRFCASSWSCK